MFFGLLALDLGASGFRIFAKPASKRWEADMATENRIPARGSLARLLFAGCAVLALSGTMAIPPAQASSASQSDEGGKAGSTLRLARASRGANDFASAINLYRQALQADPQNAQIQLELAETLVDAGSYDDAIYAFNQIPANSPVHAEALLGLMHVELALNEPVKAVSYADAAMAAAPQNPKVLVGRGVALDMAGRHAEAQQSYRSVIAADPHDVAARNDLALSLALTGNFREAIEIMEPIALSSNATPRSRQNLALIYGLSGDDAHATELSRLDLDANTTASNIRLFQLARGGRN